MKRLAVVVLAGMLCVSLFCACSSSPSSSYQDGVYRAEYAEFDAYGYKQYLEVTVEGGVVTAMDYDAVTQTGSKKNDDEDYRAAMEVVQGTYPEKFSSDLVNQYLNTQNINEVDAVAGATEASDSFVELFNALEPSMRAGTAETVVI